MFDACRRALSSWPQDLMGHDPVGQISSHIYSFSAVCFLIFGTVSCCHFPFVSDSLLHQEVRGQLGHRPEAYCNVLSHMWKRVYLIFCCTNNDKIKKSSWTRDVTVFSQSASPHVSTPSLHLLMFKAVSSRLCNRITPA